MALKEQVSNVYGVGLRNVGSYQVSGTPWVTGSAITQDKTQRYEFPTVPKSFTVINTHASTEIYLHFHSQATFSGVGGSDEQSYAASHRWRANGHYITLGAGDTVSLNTKQRYIYISEPNAAAGSFQIFAELTNIPIGRMYALTGSGIDE